MTSHPAPSDAPDLPDPTSEVTSGRLLRNTVVNGLANSASAITTALLTPFLLHRLGPEAYGVWLLALTLTFSNGYLALADFGLPEAAVKFIAEARASGDGRIVNNIASTTTAYFAGLGLVLGCAIALLAPILVRVFSVSSALEATAQVVFAVMALEVVIALPTAGLLAVIEASQRYGALRAIDVSTRILWAAAVVIAVGRGHGVVAMAVASLAAAGLKAVGAIVVAHRVHPGLRLRVGMVDRATFKRTFSYGSFIGGLRFLSVVYSQMDRAIVGIMLSVAAVSRYEIAFRIQSLATLVLAVASSAVLPAAAYNAGRGDETRQRELYLRGTKYAIALVVPVTLAALIFARALISAWVGPRYTDMTAATRLFLVFPLFACVNQVGVAMLIGLGRVRRVLLLQAVGVTINLGVSVALAPSLGVRGVVIGTLVGGLVVWAPYVRVMLRTFRLDVRAWFARVIVPNLPGAALQVVTGVVAIRYLVSPSPGLLVVGLLCAASCATNVGMFAVAGLTAEERRHLLRRLLRG